MLTSLLSSEIFSFFTVFPVLLRIAPVLLAGSVCGLLAAAVVVVLPTPVPLGDLLLAGNQSLICTSSLSPFDPFDFFFELSELSSDPDDGLLDSSEPGFLEEAGALLIVLVWRFHCRVPLLASQDLSARRSTLGSWKRVC